MGNRWDQYFWNICECISSQSRCFSRKLGSIIVRDRSVIASGYNGPARGIPHCNERYTLDKSLIQILPAFPSGDSVYTCPRRVLGFKSGEGIEHCYAVHSETNCIANAAKNGVNTSGTTLYLNWVTPCASCLSNIINAGIIEVVVTELTPYNDHAQFIIDHANIKIRTFDL